MIGKCRAKWYPRHFLFRCAKLLKNLFDLYHKIPFLLQITDNVKKLKCPYVFGKYIGGQWRECNGLLKSVK